MDLQLLLNDFCSELKNRSGNLTEDSVRYYLFACMLRQDPQLNNYMLELPYEDMLDSLEKQNGLPVYIASETLPKGDLGNESKANGKGNINLELDMCYYNGSQCFSVEIKFHRHPDNASAFPHTMSAGSLFNDIRRLEFIQSNPLVKEYARLFLYVTDKQMHDYLLPNENGVEEKDADKRSNEDNLAYRSMLNRFYSLEPGTEDHFIFEDGGDPPTPETFLRAANKSLPGPGKEKGTVDVRLKKVYDSDFLSGSNSLKDGSCHVRLYQVLDRYTNLCMEE